MRLTCADKPGFVYCLQAEHSGHIKIGRARDVRRRLGYLQVGSAERLFVLGVFPTKRPAALERHFHLAWARQRIRGEWFISSRELVNFMEDFGETLEGDRMYRALYGELSPRRPAKLVRLMQ